MTELDRYVPPGLKDFLVQKGWEITRNPGWGMGMVTDSVVLPGNKHGSIDSLWLLPFLEALLAYHMETHKHG